MDATKCKHPEGCTRDAAPRQAGWCSMHYKRFQQYGDPGPVESYWGKGTVAEDGSLYVRIGGKKKFLHRLVMEEALGRELLSTEKVVRAGVLGGGKLVEECEFYGSNDVGGMKFVDGRWVQHCQRFQLDRETNL